MSLNSSHGPSVKPSERFRLALRSLQRKVSHKKRRPIIGDILASEFLPENKFDVNPAETFEFEITSRVYPANPQASSHGGTEDDDCSTACHSQTTENSDGNSHYNPRESRDIDSIQVCVITPPSSCGSSSIPGSGASSETNSAPSGRFPERKLRRMGLAGLPINPNVSYFPNFSELSERSSSPQDNFADFNRASKVSIRVSVSIVRSSMGPEDLSSPSEDFLNAEVLTARFEKLDCNSPMDFIHYKRFTGPVEPKKRSSSFGIARIIISAPTALQASQLSPTFKTWLVDFVENRLNLDESAESLGQSFDTVIPEEGSSFEHDQEIYPGIIEEHVNESLDPQ